MPTAQQWQEITDRWAARPRTVTVAQLARHYGSDPGVVAEGLRARGFTTAVGADEEYLLCACGCGIVVGRTHRHARYAGRVFRNVACLRRWRGSQEAKAARTFGHQHLRSMILRAVPKGVIKSWPKTWCAWKVDDKIHVYRNRQDCGRALVTGTLIVPLLVIHTRDAQ